MSTPPKYLLRSEPFGGILADRFSTKTRFYSHSAFFIIEQIFRGKSDSRIISALKKQFDVPDSTNLSEHIAICRKELEEFEKYSDRAPLVDDENESVPTLKGPLDLKIEITKRCNLNCAHCYSASDEGSLEELPWEYLKVLFEECAKDGIRFASITGGEPLLHSDFAKILSGVRSFSESLNVSTNGTLLTPDTARLIAETVDSVNISLDAPVAQLHDKFRSIAGAFDKALAAIDFLAGKSTTVVVQTTVNKLNIDSLPELGEIIEKAGASVWSVRLPLPSGNYLKNKEMFLSPEEVRECEEKLVSLREHNFSMEVYSGIPVVWSRKEPYVYENKPDRLISCAAGTIMAAVLTDRRITPCILFSGTDFAEPMPDPGEFRSLWKNSSYFNKLRQIKLHDLPLCRSCSHFGDVCQTECRAKSYLFYGDIATPDPDCDFYLNSPTGS